MSTSFPITGVVFPSCATILCLYSQYPNWIGILYTFSSKLEVSHDAGGDGKPKCENCAKQKAAGFLSRGQVILTSALLKDATDPSKPDISSLGSEDVTRYLTRNLNWRVVDVSFPSPAFRPRGEKTKYLQTLEFWHRDRYRAEIATDQDLRFE